MHSLAQSSKILALVTLSSDKFLIFITITRRGGLLYYDHSSDYSQFDYFKAHDRHDCCVYLTDPHFTRACRTKVKTIAHTSWKKHAAETPPRYEPPRTEASDVPGPAQCEMASKKVLFQSIIARRTFFRMGPYLTDVSTPCDAELPNIKLSEAPSVVPHREFIQ